MYMKKINYILLIIISMLIFSGVSAKTAKFVCKYDTATATVGKTGAVTVNIYDDGSADAVVTNINGKSSNNEENIQNWSVMSGMYKSKKTCPPYVNLYENGLLSNVKVWVYYDYNSAYAMANVQEAIILSDKTNSEVAEKDYSQMVAFIGSWTNECNSYASKYQYSVKDCQSGDGRYTSYKKCKSQAEIELKRIEMSQENVKGFVSRKYFKDTDDNIKKFNKICDSAKSNVEAFLKAMDYIICNEFEEGENCNTKKEEVEDNPYYKEYEDNKPDKEEEDLSATDLFQMCDHLKNPQFVASLKLVGIFVTIIKIIAPIILIVMGSIDMTKAVVDKDADAIQKNLIVFAKRAAAGVLVFLTPSILLGVFHLIDGFDNVKSAYETCVNCILGSSKCPNVSFIQKEEE